MDKLKKIVIGILVMLIIGHIVLYLMKESSLKSCLLGIVSMILIILSVIISKKKQQ